MHSHYTHSAQTRNFRPVAGTFGLLGCCALLGFLRLLRRLCPTTPRTKRLLTGQKRVTITRKKITYTQAATLCHLSTSNRLSTWRFLP